MDFRTFAISHMPPMKTKNTSKVLRLSDEFMNRVRDAPFCGLPSELSILDGWFTK